MVDTAGVGNDFAKSSLELVADIKKADAYLLVYDTTAEETLPHAKNYFDQILQVKGRDWVPATLVGTKTDLKRAVTTEEAAELAHTWGCPHLEVIHSRRSLIIGYSRVFISFNLTVTLGVFAR